VLDHLVGGLAVRVGKHQQELLAAHSRRECVGDGLDAGAQHARDPAQNLVANLVHYFTVPFLTASTTLKQMDSEFESVSASLGVPFYRMFWRITVPLALPAIVAISMYFFLNAMVTLSAAVFLVAPGTELAAVAVLLMDDSGDTAQAAAMSVLIIGVGLGVRLVYALVMRGVTRRTQAWLTATR